MSDDDVRKAKRMTYRLYSLGERNGSRMSGELAQLLVGNVFFQNDISSNIVKLCLEGADERTTIAPLSKAIRLFMQARDEIPRPFVGRSDCLQSSILDVLLCYISFWGQLFEYYETMYYKPVSLPDGTTDQSPANVTFEVGWSVTCLFIRDMMLSAAARSAGVAAGYDRSMSWYYFPANAVSELEEAKSLVLTVIGKIRKRGTVLVAAEGILGHISFGNAIPLTHWVEDVLDKDWNNVDRLAALGQEYFESTSIRLNVNVVPKPLSGPPVETGGDDSPLNSSFLDGLDDYSPSTPLLAISARSVSLNVRPITPLLFGHPSCDWSGIDMLAFCATVMDVCVWPQVANTVSTVGEIGISVLNVSAELVQPPPRSTPEKSAPRPYSSMVQAVLPFPTPSGLPPLQQVLTPFIPIPVNFTPTPNEKTAALLPQFTPSPRRRDSEVTFFSMSEDRPPLAETPLLALPPVPPVSCAPPTSIAPLASVPSLAALISCLIGAARKSEFTAKTWTLNLALGELGSVGSMQDLYLQVSAGENSGIGGNEQKRSRKLKSEFPIISVSVLTRSETELCQLLKTAFTRSLSGLSDIERDQVGAVARILALVHLTAPEPISLLPAIVAIAADVVCFVCSSVPLIPPTDICATGLRGAYAAGHVALFEVAKDVGLSDWMGLSLFYNDVAFVVFMEVLAPTKAVQRRSQPPQKLAPRANVWAALPDHCLLVGTELTLRWAWTPESRLWDAHQNLLRDFNLRRHGNKPTHTSTAELAELEYFMHLALMNCAVYLCELGDRLGADPVVIHLAFDLLRATVLLRPTLLAGRHMYHAVYCSLMGAQSVLRPEGPISFERMLQAALVKEGSKTAQILINKYVFKSVSLSHTSAGTVGWAHGSNALILPNGQPQPELKMLGDVATFYHSIFAVEMAQVLFSLRLLVTSASPLEAGLGPAVEGLGKKHHPSLSPGAFPAISSALGVAMQMATGQGELQFREMNYQHFINAMPLVAPFGALACLRPPGTPFANGRKGDRVFKWFPDAAVLASSDGTYSIAHSNVQYKN